MTIALRIIAALAVVAVVGWAVCRAAGMNDDAAQGQDERWGDGQ